VRNRRSTLLSALLLSLTVVSVILVRKFHARLIPAREIAGRPAAIPEIPAHAYCSASHPAFDKPFDGTYWNGWGGDPANRRSQPAGMAGLQGDQVRRLKLKWVFGVPGAEQMSAQPAVVGGRLFFGSASGRVYSVDAGSGCVYWVFNAGARVRTAITIGPVGNRWAAYFGDNGATAAHAYAVNADTGALIWKIVVDDSRYARITGAPLLASGMLYVPVTGNEDSLAADPGFQCCRFRGSLVALDAITGKQRWKSYTIAEQARPYRKNSKGVQQWSPSGAGIWSAPTADPVRREVYVGTGDSHSDPAASTSDAVMAFDMDTGALLWSHQMTPGDAWNMACVVGDPANCPQSHGDDLDFGASPILVDLPGGGRALIAGQKSGVVYSLDPGQRGKLLWQVRLGKGGLVGGIQSGPAADGQNVYVALSEVSDPFSGPPDDRQSWWRTFASDLGWIWTRARIRLRSSDDGGGTFALRLASGDRVWYTPPQCDGNARCRPAQPGAVTAIPGVVFSGSLDGHLRAYSADNGRIIWTADTARDYATVDGVPAHGGSIAGAGPVIAGGVLYVNSGYPATRGLTGNALLAFSVDGK